MVIKALFLNCTLKKLPQVSNTRTLVDKAIAILDELGVKNETIRIVDHNVAFGISSDEGRGDKCPLILEKIKACDNSCYSNSHLVLHKLDSQICSKQSGIFCKVAQRKHHPYQFKET